MTVKCPHCAAELDVSEDWVGRAVSCSVCNQEFTVNPVKPSVDAASSSVVRKPSRVKQHALVLAAEILGYVASGLGLLALVVSVCAERSKYQAMASEMLGFLALTGFGRFFVLLLFAGLLTTAILMHKGWDWTRIVFSSLACILCSGFLVSLGNFGDFPPVSVFGCFIGFSLLGSAIVFCWLPPVNAWFRAVNKRD